MPGIHSSFKGCVSNVSMVNEIFSLYQLEGVDTLPVMVSIHFILWFKSHYLNHCTSTCYTIVYNKIIFAGIGSILHQDVRHALSRKGLLDTARNKL